MGWDGTARIAFPHGTYGTEFDEQEIKNLLNEQSDSEYECQNDNELQTLLNFEVNIKSIYFVVLYLSLYVWPYLVHIILKFS